jgi:hypothetical protein
MILKGFAMLSVAIKADAAPMPLIKLRREGVIVLLRLNNEQEIYVGICKFQKGINASFVDYRTQIGKIIMMFYDNNFQKS